jgi:hypothetical protein
MCFVYWIYDDTCRFDFDSGYVGVSENPPFRLLTLRRLGAVPHNAKQRIIFEGTRAECFARRRRLRPGPGIGWNKVAGGYRRGGRKRKNHFGRSFDRPKSFGRST